MDSFDIDGLDTELVRPHFRMLVLYDTPQNRRHAVVLYAWLARQLGSNYALHSQDLSFEVLDSSETQQMAAASARDAEIVIISAAADCELPSEIRSCLELWFDEGTESSQALVALLSTPTPETATDSPLYTCLHEVAQEAKIEFFHQAIAADSPTNDLTPQLLRDMEQPIHTSNAVEEALRRSCPVRRWGLNE